MDSDRKNRGSPKMMLTLGKALTFCLLSAIFIYIIAMKQKNRTDASMFKETKVTKDLTGKVIGTSHCSTRLGNVMSAVAQLYCYHFEYGLVPVVPHSRAWLICYYFECREEILILEKVVPNYQKLQWKSFDPKNASCLDPKNSSSINPALGHYVNTGGHPHFAKLRLILKHLPKLQSMFLTMKEKYTQQADQQIQNATELFRKRHFLPENVTIHYIGIHIRRTDMKKAIRNNLTLVEGDYFERAMKIFQDGEEIKHALFIIVSDDMEWARANIISENDDCFFLGTAKEKKGTDEDYMYKGFAHPSVSSEIGNDLALLTRMNFTIMTYGTFGGWGALLSGSKKVILPRGYEKAYTIDQIIEANLSGWTFV